MVATNADGTVTGADATFRTAAPPAPAPSRPGATTGGVQNVTATSATLTGVATLRGQPTTAYFEYSNRRTPSVDLGSGTGTVPVSADIAGLSADTSVGYRLVVIAAAGRTNGARRSFRTRPAVTGAGAHALAQPRALRGRAQDLRAPQRRWRSAARGSRSRSSSFPFNSDWRQAGADKAVSGNGRYAFTITPLLTATQVRVITRSGSRIVVSPVATAHSAMKVGLVAAGTPRDGPWSRGAACARRWPAPRRRCSAARPRASGRRSRGRR